MTTLPRRALLALCGLLPFAARAQTFGDDLIQGQPNLIGGPARPPVCDRLSECRFTAGMSVVTLMNCGSPVYGREGVVSTPKPCNTATTEWRCLTCGKRWAESEPS